MGLGESIPLSMASSRNASIPGESFGFDRTIKISLQIKASHFAYFTLVLFRSEEITQAQIFEPSSLIPHSRMPVTRSRSVRRCWVRNRLIFLKSIRLQPVPEKREREDNPCDGGESVTMVVDLTTAAQGSPLNRDDGCVFRSFSFQNEGDDVDGNREGERDVDLTAPAAPTMLAAVGLKLPWWENEEEE